MEILCIVMGYLLSMFLICAVSYFKKGISYSYLAAGCKRRGYSCNLFTVYVIVLLDRAIVALLLYRINYLIGNPVIGRLVTNLGYFLTGVEIYYNAKIRSGVQLWHGQGTVIGQNAEVGSGCIILHQVTIGSGFVKVGSSVKIGCGAKLLGNIAIGDNCVISANSVVTRNISDSCLVKPDGSFRCIKPEENLSFGTK